MSSLKKIKENNKKQTKRRTNEKELILRLSKLSSLQFLITAIIRDRRYTISETSD